MPVMFQPWSFWGSFWGINVEPEPIASVLDDAPPEPSLGFPRIVHAPKPPKPEIHLESLTDGSLISQYGVHSAEPPETELDHYSDDLQAKFARWKENILREKT